MAYITITLKVTNLLNAAHETDNDQSVTTSSHVWYAMQ